MTVNRCFLHEDAEAWISIKGSPDAYLLGDQWRLLYNFDLGAADETVLLWQNSD